MKILTQERSQTKPPSSPFLIYIIILVAILLLGMITGSLFQPKSEAASNINLAILGGGIIILTGILLVFRLLKRVPVQPQKRVVTILQCTKCAFKKIRDFQLGDYIPKTVGTCPSCGGPFIIDGIYSEPITPR